MINNVVLMGRLTVAPELKQTPSGVYVTAFSVAVDRDYSKDKKTDFINVVAWRSTAEFIARYFPKGEMIALVGSIQTRNYEDKNGNKRTAVEVVADKVSFCGGKSNSDQTEQAAQSSPKTTQAKPPIDISVGADYEEISLDDDLPWSE